MKLGDILAEHFRLKAQLIRLRWGTAVILLWASLAIFILVSRVVFGIWILKSLNAPKWMWAIWILAVPAALLIEQIEKK